MPLSHITLFVSDVAASVAFYETAFGLQRQFLHDSGQLAETGHDGATLHCAAREAARAGLPGGFRDHDRAAPPTALLVCLETDAVAPAFERARAAGALALQPPVVKPWGQTVTVVRDPDGVLVEPSNASW